MLTLFTTPVVYLYLDRMRVWAAGRRAPGRQSPTISPRPHPAD
jgi:multidrug efflux pump